MAVRGFQDVIKRWPAFFAFFTFTLGVFGVARTLQGLNIFDPLPYIAQYGWFLVPGLIGVAIVDRLFPNKSEARDNDECLDRCVYVVTSTRRLIAELYEDENSVVKGSKKFLHVMGSRSRDKPYLDAIEAKLKLTPNIEHVRILVGNPHHPVLESHIKALSLIAQNRNISAGHGPIQVCKYELGGPVAERFIAVSETKAVITLPSLSSAKGYDTALVVENDAAAKRLGSILQTLAQDCDLMYVDRGKLKHAERQNEQVEDRA